MSCTCSFCAGCGWAVVWSHSVWTDVRTSSTAVLTADTPSGSSTGCKSKRIYRFQQQNTNQEKKCPSFHLFNLDWYFWIKLCWVDKLVNFFVEIYDKQRLICAINIRFEVEYIFLNDPLPLAWHKYAFTYNDSRSLLSLNLVNIF